MYTLYKGLTEEEERYIEDYIKRLRSEALKSNKDVTFSYSNMYDVMKAESEKSGMFEGCVGIISGKQLLIQRVIGL